MPFEALSNLATGFLNYDIAGNNYRLQQANLDYQKALQEKIFQREDTAVQRRMEDLRKAGLNPYLAAGQSAGSGSVVSTQAPQFQMDTSPFAKVGAGVGAYIDMRKSLQQLKQDELYTQYLNMQNIDFANKLFENWSWQDDDGMYGVRDARNNISKWSYLHPNASNTLMGKIIRQNLTDVLNQGYLLQTERNFAVSNQIEKYLMDTVNMFGVGAKGYRTLNPYDYSVLQPKFRSRR